VTVLPAKSPRVSEVTFSRVMTLLDANAVGNVHGGVIMREVDTAAGAAAARHAGVVCVTAAIDELSFEEPVHVGELLIVQARVNLAGRTSLEVGVRVEAEDVTTGRRVHTSSAYLVFVALDREGQPRAVAPLLAENEEERQRQREAKLRREARLARKNAIEEARRAKGEV
jgi:acyl-CoA hydrolase